MNLLQFKPVCVSRQQVSGDNVASYSLLCHFILVIFIIYFSMLLLMSYLSMKIYLSMNFMINRINMCLCAPLAEQWKTVIIKSNLICIMLLLQTNKANKENCPTFKEPESR